MIKTHENWTVSPICIPMIYQEHSGKINFKTYEDFKKRFYRKISKEISEYLISNKCIRFTQPKWKIDGSGEVEFCFYMRVFKKDVNLPDNEGDMNASAKELEK